VDSRQGQGTTFTMALPRTVHTEAVGQGPVWHTDSEPCNEPDNMRDSGVAATCAAAEC
jgi:hypothetical protein